MALWASLSSVSLSRTPCQDQGLGSSSIPVGMGWAQAMLSIIGMPKFCKKTSGKRLPMPDFRKVQHHHCYPKEGRPGAVMVHVSHLAPLEFLEKTIIIIIMKNRTNKGSISRVVEQAEMCREGCEEAHTGLSQTQPHHHHLAQLWLQTCPLAMDCGLDCSEGHTETDEWSKPIKIDKHLADVQYTHELHARF